jgi:hydroxypyruvate isomerase
LFNGESNYPFILGKIIQAGYRGHFGLEYIPELESAQSLTRTREYIG